MTGTVPHGSRHVMAADVEAGGPGVSYG